MEPKVYWVLGAVLLLAYLQPAWGLFDCGAYDNPSKEKLQRCAEVVEALESALLNSKINLHILRDAFLSGSSPPPSLLGVIYEINTIGRRDSVAVQWSSSRVFTMIDPRTIHALQPGIMTLIYYWEGISFLQTIKLYLDVPINKNFTESEFNYAIVVVTERLRAYAVTQKPLSDWDGRHKGFVIFGASISWKKKLVIYALVPTTTVLIFIFGTAFSFKMITKLSTLDQSHQAHVKISLFWSFISVLLFTNIIETLLQISSTVLSETGVIGPNSSQINDSSPLSLKMNRDIQIAKLVFIFIVFNFGSCVGACCDKKRLPPNPKSRQVCCSSDFEIAHQKAFSNIFLLVFFISTSFVTTAALLFVYPVLVLSTVAYICTSIFCVVAVLALPSSLGMMCDKFEKQRNVSEFRRNCAYLCYYILYIIAIIAGNLLMLMFLIMISSADNTYPTGIIQDATSFLPSAFLGVVGYFAKKKLTAKSKEKRKLSEDELEGVSHRKCKCGSMEAVEEGRARANSSDEFYEDDHKEVESLLPNKEETKI